MFGLFGSKGKAEAIIKVMHDYYRAVKVKFPNKKEVFYLMLAWTIYAKKHHPVRYKDLPLSALRHTAAGIVGSFVLLKSPDSIDALAYFMVHEEKLSIKYYEPKFNVIMAKLGWTRSREKFSLTEAYYDKACKEIFDCASEEDWVHVDSIIENDFNLKNLNDEHGKAEAIIKVMHDYYHAAKVKFPNRKDVFYLMLAWTIYAKKNHPVQYKDLPFYRLFPFALGAVNLFCLLDPPDSIDAFSYDMVHSEKLRSFKDYEPRFNKIMAKLEITQAQLDKASKELADCASKEMGLDGITENDFNLKNLNDEHGYRFVPITSGIISIGIAVIVFWLIGNNILTWLISGFLIYWGWGSLKIGLFGTQKLLDEMTLSKEVLSEDSRKEWENLHK
jgi:hypothetical protein